MSSFANYPPILQALLAGLGTWAATALGATAVFPFRTIPKKLLNTMLGSAAGIMLAASFWSLLAPALALSKGGNLPAWLPPSLGFLAGGAFLLGLDKVLPHLHLDRSLDQAEGIHTSLQRSILLVLAVTLHNIPEGVAVGVAFGAAAAGGGTLTGAAALAMGIAIQNVPEGAAVSIPLRREGLSRWRAFNYGQLSGLVEPLGALVGAWAVGTMTRLLPYALSFAAGAMVFVVAEELIPEAQADQETDWSTIGLMLGFVIMMVLDVALG